MPQRLAGTCTEPPVSAVRCGEVTELVRQHGLELFGRETIQQRKTDG
jgi:hypothetical protein